MKKILIQLDTDRQPSPFDAIVAYDAGVDVVHPCPGVTPADVRALVQGAFFTRGVGDLAAMSVWVGGADVTLGEAILAEVQDSYFGPFRTSAMLDCNGCNTTAATAIAMLARARDLRGRRAVIVGVGPVGLRSAKLLLNHGCDVVISSIPAELFPAQREYRRPAGIQAARALGIDVAEPATRADLLGLLQRARIVLAAGPSGVRILRRRDWIDHPTIEVLADYNAAEPLGIEGIAATDALCDHDGKLLLGALGVGDLKMRVHKACVQRMFERNDIVLDIDGVFAVAQQIV